MHHCGAPKKKAKPKNKQKQKQKQKKSRTLFRWEKTNKKKRELMICKN